MGTITSSPNGKVNQSQPIGPKGHVRQVFVSGCRGFVRIFTPHAKPFGITSNNERQIRQLHDSAPEPSKASIDAMMRHMEQVASHND